MITLNQSQIAIFQQILTAVWVGDAYRLADVEQCLAWLQADRIHISCPFEQAMGRTLAQEFIAQKTIAALKEIPA